MAAEGRAVDRSFSFLTGGLGKEGMLEFCLRRLQGN